MSSSGADQVHHPVLVATDPVISHEVPVPVDGQVLKDVSNLGSKETPASAAGEAVSLIKTDASNGDVSNAVEETTISTEEKENAASDEQPTSAGADPAFVNDKEATIHGSDIALEKTDIQEAPVVDVDNAASDIIATDNIDDMTLNEHNDIISVKDISSASQVEERVATAEHGSPINSDSITPVADTTEANTIDNSVNDSAIDIPSPALEKKDANEKDNEGDAGPNDDGLGVNLVEAENAKTDERNATDNVEDTPEVLNRAQDGETLAEADVSFQGKENVVSVDADGALGATDDDALITDEAPECREENFSITVMAPPEEPNVTDCDVAQVDAADVSVEPAATMKDDVVSDLVESEAVVVTPEDEFENVTEGVKQTISEIASIAEEQPKAVATDPIEIVAEPTLQNEIEVTPDGVRQDQVDEASAQPAELLGASESTSELDATNEVKACHEVESIAENVENIEEAIGHAGSIHLVDGESEVTLQVSSEASYDENEVVAVDRATRAVEGPMNGTEADISTPAEAEQVTGEADVVPAIEAEFIGEYGTIAASVESAALKADTVVTTDEVPTAPEVEPVDANSEPIAEPKAEAADGEGLTPADSEPVSASDVTKAPADEPVTADADTKVAPDDAIAAVEEFVPASEAISVPVFENGEVAPIAGDAMPEAHREVANGEPSATFEASEAMSAPIDKAVEAKNEAKSGDTEAPVQVEVEPVATSEDIAAPIEEPSVTETEISNEEAPARLAVEPIAASEVIPAVAEIGTVAPEGEAETIEGVRPPRGEIIADETNEGGAVTVEAEPLAGTGEVAEKANEVEILGHVNVGQETPVLDVTTLSDAKAAEHEAEQDVEELATVAREPDTAACDNDDEVTDGTASTPVEAELVTTSEAADEVAPPFIGTTEEKEPSAPAICIDNKYIVEAQATHSAAGVESTLETTEASTGIAEVEAVAEEMPASAVEAESAIADTEFIQEAVTSIEEGPGVDNEESSTCVAGETTGIKDDLEATEEASAPFETDSNGPLLAVEAESAEFGISVVVESADEDVFVPVAAEVAAVEMVREIVTEEPAADEVGEHALSELTAGELQVVNGAPVQDIEGESPEAGIKDSTEVVLEDTSVALATSVEETSSVEPEGELKIEGETVIEAQQSQNDVEIGQPSTHVLEPVQKHIAEDENEQSFLEPLILEEIATTPRQEAEVTVDDVSVDGLSNAPVVDIVTTRDNMPELKTDGFSIETSLDTTTFTPVLDSGIELKEQAAVPSKLDSIAEEFERPKSPWPSSFQVSTIGGDESLGSGVVPGSIKSAEPSEPANVPVLTVEDLPANEENLAIGASEDITSVDQPSLEPPARPWTPSYSVHSQGSPMQMKVELAEDVPSADQPVSVPKLDETATIAPELPHREQGELGSVLIDDDVINQSRSLEQLAETAPSTGEELYVPPTEVGEISEAAANLTEVVAAVIAPASALATADGTIQEPALMAEEKTAEVDGALTVDTTAIPLLSVPSSTVDGGATDAVVDAAEHPRSPWTPSYSVTKQGACLSQEEVEVNHLEPLPLTSSSESESQLNEVQEGEPQPNSLQARPSHTVTGTEGLANNEQFFLFGLRAIVAYLWVLPKWLSTTPSEHSRRGSSSSSSSSSSSRFFPGGWFTPKPNEGRTSFDIAQGEFASSPKVTTTSNDVFETLSSEAMESSAVVNVAEDDGQKRKWCIVM